MEDNETKTVFKDSRIICGENGREGRLCVAFD
jgi:hypothetical protein